jgi:hypothetical protein
MKTIILDLDGRSVEVAITRPDYAKQGRAPHLVLTATCGSTVIETPVPLKVEHAATLDEYIREAALTLAKEAAEHEAIRENLDRFFSGQAV